MTICEVYAATTLTISTLWIYYAKDHAVGSLTWIMFFPGLFAPWFNDDPELFWKMLGFGKSYQCVFYSVVAVVFVFASVILTLTIGLITKWASSPHHIGNTLKQTVGLLISSLSPFSQEHAFLDGFLRAVGEEVGWRCYLLPCLLSYYPIGKALTLSATVWALFHLPAMVLLTGRPKIRHRWRTIGVQMLACMVYSVLFSFVAIKSGFTLWPVSVMHFVWNRWTPLVFGSIYSNSPGRVVSGQQWLINGEGLAGTLAGLIPGGLILHDIGIL